MLFYRHCSSHSAMFSKLVSFSNYNLCRVGLLKLLMIKKDELVFIMTQSTR